MKASLFSGRHSLRKTDTRKMKLLTFGLFIAAITVQISAVEIVQEREDGEGDLESRIDVESEEERVKALDVESRK